MINPSIPTEARSHGAGFMKFSKDEKKRKEQMDLLKELRTETQRAEATKANAASKRQKLMQVRLEKVRQRKRLKMGLPMRGKFVFCTFVIIMQT